MTQQELLEQTDDSPRDFSFLLGLYGGNLAQLKDALLWLSSEEMLEIRETNGAHPLQVSELKALWCDDGNFLDAERAKRLLVQATQKGLKRAY